MPPEARNQLLNSDEFRNNFTDEQRELAARHDRSEPGRHTSSGSDSAGSLQLAERCRRNHLTSMFQPGCCVGARQIRARSFLLMIELVRQHIPLSRVDLGARPQGAEDPLQAVGPGIPVGAAQSGLAHAGADPGLFHGHAFPHTALRHFSAQRVCCPGRSSRNRSPTRSKPSSPMAI